MKARKTGVFAWGEKAVELSQLLALVHCLEGAVMRSVGVAAAAPLRVRHPGWAIRKRGLAAAVTAVALCLAPAAAARNGAGVAQASAGSSSSSARFQSDYRGTYWGATAYHVAYSLANYWSTSDYVRYSYVYCTGRWGSRHFFRYGHWYFHRLGCDAWDVLNRDFTLSVVITGRYTMRATQTGCSDADSSSYCPGYYAADSVTRFTARH
jgi:hypothetical protein